jgi:hypothetical protein
MTDPSVTDWISAVSTAALGVLGTFITVWQWRLTKFRPKLSSRIDARREAVELVIVNKGRASGIIDQVDVLGSDDSIETDVSYEGFSDGSFRPVPLPALSSMRIVIQAPAGRTLSSGVQLLVGIGKARPKVIVPVRGPASVGLFGLRSVLPPGTAT